VHALLTDVFVQVLERFRGPLRLDACLLLHLPPEVGVAEGDLRASVV
jgi:hypothetical protein